MKQMILIETNEQGKQHIFGMLGKELDFLKLSQPIKINKGYALYFTRLEFSKRSYSRLKLLESELKLMAGNYKFEYYNS